MGLVAMPAHKSVEEDVRSAKANLQLFLDDNCNPRSYYLLGFARGCINSAEEILNTPPKKLK